jgi:hypothetical protein
LTYYWPRANTEKAIKEERRPEKTRRACFLKGGNSTCRGHIAGFHFTEYERRCKAQNLKLNHRCIPEDVARARSKKEKEGPVQMKLEFGKAIAVAEFTREGVLDAVAKFIACDNQVRLHPSSLMECSTFDDLIL